MFRMLLAPVVIGVALSTAACAADPMQIKEIDVQIELTDLSNRAAGARFANVETDLENALTSRLTDRLADEGAKITVDLSEFELSNSYRDVMNLADTRLVGDVSISDEKDNSNFDTYKLTVDVNSSAKFLPEGFDPATLKPDSDVYYKAMIAAFADGVVTRLKN